MRFMRRLTIVLLIAMFTALAAAVDFAGAYAGEWKSNGSGNGGAIHFKLNSSPSGGWTCDLTFGLQGSDVKTTMREVRVQDRKVVKGEWNGSAFAGTFETSLLDGSAAVDSGTWNAARQK
jgi:hypothetical protein